MKIGTSLYKYGDGTEKAKIHIVADEGMSLTLDGIDFWNCVDVDSLEGWQEVETPTEIFLEGE